MYPSWIQKGGYAPYLVLRGKHWRGQSWEESFIPSQVEPGSWLIIKVSATNRKRGNAFSPLGFRRVMLGGRLLTAQTDTVRTSRWLSAWLSQRRCFLGETV